MPERTGKGRRPSAPMSAARAVEILDLLERHGVSAWVDGGWAVDALLGRQTREHDDLDLIVRLDEVEALEAALHERGYETGRGAPPTSFELVDEDGHQVDAHPAAFAPTGEAVYRMENGEDWIFPASGFAGTGEIAGRRVPCLTPEVVLVSHSTGYALDAAHQRDVEALCERFGLPLPPFETA